MWLCVCVSICTCVCVYSPSPMTLLPMLFVSIKIITKVLILFVQKHIFVETACSQWKSAAEEKQRGIIGQRENVELGRSVDLELQSSPYK